MIGATIPANILQSTGMSASELITEVAVMLYQKEKLTLAQASNFADFNRLQFQHLLASRNITINYDIPEFEEDLATLKKLGRL